jgi:ferritin
LLKLNSGSKSQIKTIKSIIKNVLKYCINEGDQLLKQFIEDIVREELLHKSIKTVKGFYESSSNTVKEYFKTEDKVINEINPFLFVFLVNCFIELAPSYLLSDSAISVSTLIPNLINISLYSVLHF